MGCGASSAPASASTNNDGVNAETTESSAPAPEPTPEPSKTASASQESSPPEDHKTDAAEAKEAPEKQDVPRVSPTTSVATSRTSSKERLAAPLWEFRNDDFAWQPFQPDDAQLLEDFFEQNPSGKFMVPLSFIDGDVGHDFNFSDLTETDQQSGKSWRIRRGVHGPKIKSLPAEFHKKVARKLTPGDFVEKVGSEHTMLTYLMQTNCVEWISGTWILEQRHSSRPLQRRQDLPREAFSDSKKMTVKASLPDEQEFGNSDGLDKVCSITTWPAIIMIVLSYGWIRKGHPDPECFLLTFMAAKLSSLYERLKATSVSVAVFWDFLSLDQNLFNEQGRVVLYRTKIEQQRFRAALEFMPALYGHVDHFVWRLNMLPDNIHPEVAARGWPCFEQAVYSTSSKRIRVTERFSDASTQQSASAAEANVLMHPITVFQSANQRFLCDNVDTIECTSGQEVTSAIRPLKQFSTNAPMNPVRFGQELKSKVFTDEWDMDDINRLYKDMYLEWLTTSVAFVWLEDDAFLWRSGDLHQLADVLSDFKSLQTLRIRSQLTGTGGGFVLRSAAMLPSLKILEVCGTAARRHQPKCIGSFVKALASNTSLEEFRLRQCQIDDIAALGQAISTNTTLVEIEFDHDITPMAEGLVQNTTLKKICIPKNCPCVQLQDDPRVCLVESDLSE